MKNEGLTRQTEEHTVDPCRNCACKNCAKQGISELCPYCKIQRCGARGKIYACPDKISIPAHIKQINDTLRHQS
jgi:hypothetical protein